MLDETKGVFLLIHGFTGMRKEMRPLANFLSSLGYKTELLVLPGHETTPEDLKTKKWTDWVDYVLDKINQAKKEHNKVFVSGLSLGGALSLYSGAKEPSLAGIIVISAPFIFPSKKIYILKLLPFLKKLVPRIENKEKGWEDMQALKEHQSYSYFYIESALQLHHFLEDLQRILPLVKVPTLIIHSKNDPVLPVSHANNIFNLICSTKKKLVLIEHGGHIVTEDAGKEEAFNAIANWLKTLE